MASDPSSIQGDGLRLRLAEQDRNARAALLRAQDAESRLPDLVPRWVYRRIQAKESLSSDFAALVNMLELDAGSVIHAAMIQVPAVFAGPSLTDATCIVELDGDFTETGKSTGVTLRTSPTSADDFWIEWHAIAGPGVAMLRVSISLTGCTWDNLTGGEVIVYALVSHPGSPGFTIPLGEIVA
jgi:hypothetical protein